MPPFTVVPCVADDAAKAAALARNNMSAFWTDSTWVLIWRGKTLEYVIAQASLRMPNLLQTDRDHRRHQMAIDAKSGAIVGYVRWELPHSLPATAAVSGDVADLWPEAKIPALSEERTREVKHQADSADWSWDHASDALDVPLLEKKHRLMNGKNYLVLDYLAVHPDHRGQGIATMLVESGVREADKMGLDIFVVAFKAGHGVYKKAGFKVLEQLTQDDSKFGGQGDFTFYMMLRECKQR